MAQGWKQTELLTDAESDCRPWPSRDFSRPQVVCNSSEAKLKGGGSAWWRRSQIFDENMSIWMSKHNFLTPYLMFKHLRDFSIGIGILYLSGTFQFCCKLDIKVGKVT
jgi:hypothetical protein